MQNVVIDKPYVPTPPYRGRIWPMVLGWYVPRMLRKNYGVTDVQCVNAERLQESIRAGVIAAAGRPWGLQEPGQIRHNASS
ncbi:MAG TPA: hypothetical protein VKK61_03350 [Tepidisphaeraceae bacterium]|nr:hypothetical protein [Tepidisphaeraceae bacterium]